jgi:DNA-directed RNA polymerase subunit RPC12/RpoP
MKECKECKTEFKPEKSNQQYCSLECKREKKNKNRRVHIKTLNCQICNKEYETKRGDKITCSPTCSQRLWVKNNPEKNKIRQQSKTPFNKKNLESFRIIQRKYKDKKRREDDLYNLYEKIANSIRGSLKKINTRKDSRTVEILGCSIDEFKQHLEKQFEHWMSWDNYGKYNGELNYGWDIDHIEPLFPIGVKRTKNDIVLLNHYTNLQPLCSKINRHVKKNQK